MITLATLIPFAALFFGLAARARRRSKAQRRELDRVLDGNSDLRRQCDHLRADLARQSSAADRLARRLRLTGLQLAVERRRVRTVERERDEALAAGLVHAGVIRRLREQNAALSAATAERLVSRAVLEASVREGIDLALYELELGQ